MSDDFGQDSSGGVRRVSSRDRKRRIEPRNLSFPPDDLPIDETQPPAAPAHDDTQGLPSTPHPQPLSHASGETGFQRFHKRTRHAVSLQRLLAPLSQPYLAFGRGAGGEGYA
jgi:hypothetical protein